MYADYYHTRLLHVITAVEFERSLGSVVKSVASGSVSVYRAGRTGLNPALRLFYQCSLSVFISYLVLYHFLILSLSFPYSPLRRRTKYGKHDLLPLKKYVIVVEVSLVIIHRVVSAFI